MEYCSPHDWQQPQAGDTHLHCDTCGRGFPILEGVERLPGRFASIYEGQLRKGADWAEDFGNGLCEAIEHLKTLEAQGIEFDQTDIPGGNPRPKRKRKARAKPEPKANQRQPTKQETALTAFAKARAAGKREAIPPKPREGKPGIFARGGTWCFIVVFALIMLAYIAR